MNLSKIVWRRIGRSWFGRLDGSAYSLHQSGQPFRLSEAEWIRASIRHSFRNQSHVTALAQMVRDAHRDTSQAISDSM